MLSRILGLLRDSLFFSAFGASLAGEAFLLAFTFPNLFRRMLGEGSLNSAFLPVFTETKERKGEARAWSLLNQVVSRLLLWFGAFALVVCAFSWICGSFSLVDSTKWALAAQLNGVTFFYAVFICSSAILVGALNVYGRFWEGAFSPVALNLCMIFALLISTLFHADNLHLIAFCLGAGVLFAGVVQFCLPWIVLKKHGWNWKVDLGSSEEMSKVIKLFWVSAIGATVAQLNVLTSRFLAFLMDETGGLSYLYMSARLVELPLGLFAIGISTILFPALSRARAKDNDSEYKESFFLGFKLIAGITLPATVGLYLLGEPIIRCLFEWNAFGPDDTLHAARVLQVVAWSIPFYAFSSFLVKAFHSGKNMRVPFQGAVTSLLVNLVLSLLLMGEYGVIGLAWANLISAICQAFFLMWKNEILGFGSWFDPGKVYFQAPMISSLGMGFFLHFASSFFEDTGGKSAAFTTLLALIPSSALVFFIVMKIMGFSWSATTDKSKAT